LQWLNLFRIIASNQNVLIYTSHIKKVIVKRYFFYSEKQNNW